VTGLVTAATIAAVLLFFTGPLQYVPVAALGAVLVKAAFSLLDLRTLKTFYQMDRRELVLSLIATLGVAAVGAVQAILVAVVLALLRFVNLVSRPKVEILGRVPGLPGLHSTDRHRDAATVSGLLLFRFNAPLVFFNAPFFKRSVLEAADAAGPDLKWFVMDMIPVTMIDITGLQTAADVVETLRGRGVVFIAAGRETEWRNWAERHGVQVGHRSFPTLRAALKEYERDDASPVDASPLGRH
jgi:MFS superfamily sulfate permease-like transporter